MYILPTVADTMCKARKTQDYNGFSAAEVFAKNMYYRVCLGPLAPDTGGRLLCKSAFAIDVGVGTTRY